MYIQLPSPTPQLPVARVLPSDFQPAGYFRLTIKNGETDEPSTGVFSFVNAVQTIYRFHKIPNVARLVGNNVR